MLSIFRCPLEEWKWNFSHESLSEKKQRRVDIERWTRIELILLLNRVRSFKIEFNASLADWNYLSRIMEKVFLCGLCGEHDRNQSRPTRMVLMVLRLPRKIGSSQNVGPGPGSGSGSGSGSGCLFFFPIFFLFQFLSLFSCTVVFEWPASVLHLWWKLV